MTLGIRIFFINFDHALLNVPTFNQGRGYRLLMVGGGRFDLNY